jgi:hypothetical protein
LGVPLSSWARSGSKWSAYREFAPDPGMAAVVSRTWLGRPGWARDLRVLPDGCLDLVWNGLGLYVVVPAVAPLHVPVPGAGTTAGLRLRCGIGTSLLGVRVSELPPGPAPLAELWPEAQRAEDQLAAGTTTLQDLVRARLTAGYEPDRRIVAAASRLRSAHRTASVASGLSDRGLRRRFQHELGHGPKQVHRIMRFQRFLQALPSLSAKRTTLASVAADLGYTDQSHMGRECLRLSGSSPAALVRAFGRNVPDPGAGRGPGWAGVSDQAPSARR